MPELYLAAASYGGYISIFKLVLFLICFFPPIMILRWIYTDSEEIETNQSLWTGMLLGVYVVSTFLWLLIPSFGAGLAIYVVLVAVVSLSYVKHRNARVLEYDRVLTIEQIASLFSKQKQEKLDTLRNFSFITANNNEIPMPQPKTPEFHGYRAAYDLLNDALYRRTDSITVKPTAADYSVTYEIDGVATKQPSLDKDQVKVLIHFFKMLADLDVNEKRKPQKSKFKLQQGRETIQWSIVTAGTTAGEQMQLLKTAQYDVHKLDTLGFTPKQVEQMQSLKEQSKGVFIFSGPAKSGVTNTLYVTLRNHDAFLNNIVALEKKPAADLDNITQTVFKLTESGTVSYARTLTSMIRRAPDIVGVAECEDAETAKTIADAAADNVLIYTIIQADSVVKTFVKWLQFVGDRSKALEPLLGIANQRLMRRLCDECKQGYAPNKDLLRKFSLPAEKAKVLYRPGKVVFDKRGKEVQCATCQGTGYLGRTAVYEMIMFTDDIKQSLAKAKNVGDINTILRKAKMLYLQEQALLKVVEGTISVNEMIRALGLKKN